MQKRNFQEIVSFSLCVIVAFLMYLLLVLQLAFLIPLISLFLILVTTLNLQLGLTVWVIIAPLTPIVSGQIESIPMLFNPALVIGVISNILCRRKSLIHHKKTLALFIYIMMSTLLVTIFYQYYESVNAVIDFVLTILISYIIIICYLNYDNINSKFAFGLLLAGLVAFAFALTEGMDTRRLNVGGSVRQLSNILGFSSIFLVLTLFHYRRNLKYFTKVILLISLIPLVVGLVLTISRGVIIAFSSTLFLSLCFYFYFSRNMTKMVSMIIGIGIFIFVIYIFGHDFFVAHFGSYLDVLDQRFQDDALSSGSGIRQYIWEKVLSTYSPIEWVFGTGIGGFRHKSSLIGVYYYSHSVFIDAIASAGIFVFVSIILVIIKNSIRALKAKNVFVIGVLLFTIMNFLTHGSITSLLFWMGIGISIGTNLKLSNNESIRLT